MSPELSRRLAAILGFNWVYPMERERVIGAALAVDAYDELPVEIRDLLDEIATRGPARPEVP